MVHGLVVFQVSTSLRRYISIQVTYQCAESAEECVPEVAEREGEVLVEEVAEELAHSVVGPAAVDEQQPLQKAELRDAVVRGQHRLHPLLPRYAHADVGR